MTTIAWDGKTLASDSQQQSSYIQKVPSKKVRSAIVRDEVVIFGLSGSAGQAEAFSDWVDRGMPKEEIKCLAEEHFSALIVIDGQPFRVEQELVKFPAGTPAAVGSGCEFAMGAMMAGADARQAVKIAIELDPNSGGDVQAIDF